MPDPEAHPETADESPEYAAFVEKFRARRTTDDCMTPPNIYAAVLAWAARRYGFDPARAVRPFWPGEDYRRRDYPEGCVVVDNPPFSIVSQIVRFYMARGIPFLLFAPGLSTFTAADAGANYLCCGVSVTYDNGAKVSTSFITSFGENRVESAPDLRAVLDAADQDNLRAKRKTLRRLAMPEAVATAARLNWLAAHGVRFAVRPEECLFIRRLDCGTDLFGGAFLLSERAAAERAAAERLSLSERERALQASLSLPRSCK